MVITRPPKLLDEQEAWNSDGQYDSREERILKPPLRWKKMDEAI